MTKISVTKSQWLQLVEWLVTWHTVVLTVYKHVVTAVQEQEHGITTSSHMVPSPLLATAVVPLNRDLVVLSWRCGVFRGTHW